MWAQIAAHEVDGPSLQSSTQHLYTLLMPPTWTLRGCMWAMEWPPLELGEQLKRQVQWPDLQVQRLQVLWTPEGGGWEMVVLEAKQGFFTGG